MGIDTIFVGNEKPDLAKMMALKKYLESHKDTILSTTKDGKLFFMQNETYPESKRGSLEAYTFVDYWRNDDGSLKPISIADAGYMFSLKDLSGVRKVFYVAELNVGEEFRNNGIGSIMVHYLMDLSAELGYSSFTLCSLLALGENRNKDSEFPYVDKNFIFYKNMGMEPEAGYERRDDRDISFTPMIKMLNVVKPALNRPTELSIFFTQERVEQQSCLREKINNSCASR